MKIQDLFDRDIRRPINGVVKADQTGASVVWQELDEFVVTKELRGHLNDLVDVLVANLEGGTAAAGRNGIWVSGFFGCGKSHLIKVLSYLLRNKEHHHDGESRRAVDFFEGKLEDPLLFANLRTAVEAPALPILFNIDSKADHRAGRDALLQVFLKVLNEAQGYSGDHPHIAHLERHLDEKGKLEEFHEAFEAAAGESWLQERDAWEFYRDEVIEALHQTLGQSRESVEKWVDHAESSFSLTVENFAKWVRRHLDQQGSNHRIMFLVDEVGQFIGNDTHLMLNLQTITEQLGTVCDGRAWVVVTSQEALDAVLGDLKTVKQHDFSKIQGRFRTRLPLSSANVDEVLKKRLLAKSDEALPALAGAYEGKHDILKNQLAFDKAGMTFKTYEDGEDFAACYPFPAYQFRLLQKIFESIRKAGATGLHLAQGERSLLDAFQSAAKQIGDREVGALVPLVRFYPSVEGFLDTVVKVTIDQAADNHALQPFDLDVLKVLFLIRYVDELPGSVDNLVTLCVDEIDADRLALRRRIEAALARIEGETLVARNGDLYFFLTNEERDIGREIKNTPVPSGAEERELGKLIFEDILGGHRKHTYSETGRAFRYSRICDDHPVGTQHEGSLEVAVVSPLGDRYGELSNDAACILETTTEQGRLLIRLPDDTSLDRELRTWLQTEAYVKTKHTGALPPTTRRILRDRTDENRARRKRIVASLQESLKDAAWFASGQRLDLSSSQPKAALEEALEYLIANAYHKMGFIQHLHPDPKAEIQSTLRANDVEQLGLKLTEPEANPKALDDLREYLRLSALHSKTVVLSDLIHDRYGHRPYGWPELEVVLLVARLAVRKELRLELGSAPLPLDQAYDHLVKRRRQRKVIVKERQGPDPKQLKKARQLCKKLFAKMPPTGEEAIFQFARDHLADWQTELQSYQALASSGDYPGKDEIDDILGELRRFVDEPDSARFLKRFVNSRDDLLDLKEDVDDLLGFYTNQKHTWDKLRKTLDRLRPNQLELEAHPTGGPALARLREIRRAARPYGMLHEVAEQIHAAGEANTELVDAARKLAVDGIVGLLDGVKTDLDKVDAAPSLRAAATQPLRALKQTAETRTSIAHIQQARQRAEAAFDRALTVIEDSVAPAPEPETEPEVTDDAGGPGGGAGEDISVPPPAPETAPPRVKKRRVVEPRKLLTATFIETPAQMESFLHQLRAEMTAALEADERVQIR